MSDITSPSTASLVMPAIASTQSSSSPPMMAHSSNEVQWAMSLDVNEDVFGAQQQQDLNAQVNPFGNQLRGRVSPEEIIRSRADRRYIQTFVMKILKVQCMISKLAQLPGAELEQYCPYSHYTIPVIFLLYYPNHIFKLHFFNIFYICQQMITVLRLLQLMCT
jgi:hypothetical protein